MQRQQDETEQAKLKLTNVGSQLSFSHFFVPKVEKNTSNAKKCFFRVKAKKSNRVFSELISKKTDRIGFREKKFGGKIVSDRFTTNQLVSNF